MKRATLRIKKDAVGGDGTFGFKSSPALTGNAGGAFSVTTVNGTKTEVFQNVKPGLVDVTEDDPTPAYDLTDLTCSDTADASGKSTVDKDARKASANLQAGEDVTCTFTNTKRATLR